jgi:hypothetical protein
MPDGQYAFFPTTENKITRYGLFAESCPYEIQEQWFILACRWSPYRDVVDLFGSSAEVIGAIEEFRRCLQR